MADHADTGLEKATEKTQQMNRQRPSVPNCTKVVRIFVVGVGMRPVDDIVKNDSPTRADVFADWDGKKLTPKSWLGVDRSPGERSTGADGSPGDRPIGVADLVEHQHAHDEHLGTVVILNVPEREQIEWQCDVPFRVVRIVRKDHGPFINTDNSPKFPFEMDEEILYELGGDRCTPIRSGPLKTRDKDNEEKSWHQLYKVHFQLLIGRRWKKFDPDFYGTCGN